MNTNTIPVGTTVLGRVINANGAPLDHKGELEHTTYQPLYTPDVLKATAPIISTRLLETGIKMIDLLAPVAYGSVVGMVSRSGLGKDVMMEELMHNLITRHQAVIVIASMSKTIYDTSMLREMVRDIEAEDRIAMLFEQTTDQLAVRQRLLYAAMTIALHFHVNGQETLLILDDHLITAENIAEIQQFAKVQGITTIRFAPTSEDILPIAQSTLDALDVQFSFNQERAAQNLWPALDPLISRSRLMQSDVPSLEHRLLAIRVRDSLQHYYELRERAKSETLSAAEQLLLTRGEKIDLFCTQPFTVAEAYSDIPGTYLTLAETINDFRALLDGHYDTLPASSFRFVGQIEHV
jgi:F0F1-type ATP synthase beta subunit